MDSRKQLGENIKRIREKAGKTQEELAREAKIHVSYLSRIERGVVNPSYNILGKIAKPLKINQKVFIP